MQRISGGEGPGIGSPSDLAGACMAMIDAVNCISYAPSIPTVVSLGTLGNAYKNRAHECNATANTQSPYLLLFLSFENESWMCDVAAAAATATTTHSHSPITKVTTLILCKSSFAPCGGADNARKTTRKQQKKKKKKNKMKMKKIVEYGVPSAFQFTLN